jgi:hypothetical protein
MIGLARFIQDHRGAIEYDLMTRTAYCLNDLGGALTWGALHSFITNIGTDSALARDMGKQTGWENTLKTNALLADIYDLLQVINNNLCHSKKKIKPYPRPGKGDDKKRKIGKGAITLDAMRDFIRGKQSG